MNTNKKRILVVDDEESVTRMLKLNLEQTGEYEVHTENSATHVIHAAREFHPDLFLLDVLMPDMTGDQLAGQLRSIPLWEHVPIVFLTAIGEDGYKGGDIILKKPVETSKLTTTLNGALAPAPTKP